jgi:hypothetical protein
MLEVRMRFIPTSAHGILDYLVGVALLAAPWLFGFADHETARWVTMAFGAGAILYSLLTDYELGIARNIPMSAHLILDAMSGILLAASPWLFGFSEEVWIPHVIVGVFEIIAALSTQTEPDRDRGRGQADAYR